MILDQTLPEPISLSLRSRCLSIVGVGLADVDWVVRQLDRRIRLEGPVVVDRIDARSVKPWNRFEFVSRLIEKRLGNQSANCDGIGRIEHDGWIDNRIEVSGKAVQSFDDLLGSNCGWTNSKCDDETRKLPPID